jgi:hypothetical protein
MILQSGLILIFSLPGDCLQLASSFLTTSRMLHFVLSLAGIIQLSRSQISVLDLYLLAHVTGVLTVPELQPLAEISWQTAETVKPWLEYGISATASLLDILLHINLAIIILKGNVVKVVQECLSQPIEMESFKYFFLQFTFMWGIIVILLFMDVSVFLRHITGFIGNNTPPKFTAVYPLGSYSGWQLLQIFVTSLDHTLCDLQAVGVEENQALGLGQLLQILGLGAISIQFWTYATCPPRNGSMETQPPRYVYWRKACTSLKQQIC